MTPIEIWCLIMVAAVIGVLLQNLIAGDKS